MTIEGKLPAEAYRQSIQEIFVNPNLGIEEIAARIFVAHDHSKTIFKDIDLVILARIFIVERKRYPHKRRFVREAARSLRELLIDNRESIVVNGKNLDTYNNLEQIEVLHKSVNGQRVDEG